MLIAVIKIILYCVIYYNFRHNFVPCTHACYYAQSTVHLYGGRASNNAAMLLYVCLSVCPTSLAQKKFGYYRTLRGIAMLDSNPLVSSHRKWPTRAGAYRFGTIGATEVTQYTSRRVLHSRTYPGHVASIFFREAKFLGPRDGSPHSGVQRRSPAFGLGAKPAAADDFTIIIYRILTQMTLLCKFLSNTVGLKACLLRTLNSV